MDSDSKKLPAVRIEFMDASQERRRVIRIELPAHIESMEWLMVIFGEALHAAGMGGVGYQSREVLAEADIGGGPDDEDADGG